MGGPPSTSAANARSLGRIFNALDLAIDGIIDLDERDLVFLQTEFNKESATVRQGKERALILISHSIEEALKAK